MVIHVWDVILIKKNEFNLTVCKTDSNNTLEENCITCHMPQVEGSLSDRVETPTHAYHGFAALQNKPEFLAKYIVLKVVPRNNYLEVLVVNKTPHNLLLHPMRMLKLEVEIYKNNKLIKKIEKKFHKVLGKGDKPAPPWIADKILKDTTIKPKEKRVIKIETEPKDIKVVAKIGFFIVKPKIAKKMGLQEFSEFKLLKKKVFNIN